MEFYLIGGDARMVHLADLLAADGHGVHTYALGGGDAPDLSGAGQADAVVLPLPAMRGEALNAPLAAAPPAIDKVLDALRPGQLILAGGVNSALRSGAEDRGLVLIDYLAREELAVQNAVPSSEGAIALAMEALPVTLHGARALVIGAGRIGRVLSGQLRGLGAWVALAARKPADFCWAEIWGCEPFRSDLLDECPLEDFDVIFNTVPAPVLGRAELARLKPGCLVLDLASLPGGTDFAAAQGLGIRAIHALGLPGKAAPVTAARAIQTTLYNILRERGA